MSHLDKIGTALDALERELSIGYPMPITERMVEGAESSGTESAKSARVLIDARKSLAALRAREDNRTADLTKDPTACPLGECDGSGIADNPMRACAHLDPAWKERDADPSRDA